MAGSRPPAISPEYKGPSAPSLPSESAANRRLNVLDLHRLGLTEHLNLDARLTEYLGACGQVADRTLNFLSDKAPGTELWLIEALDTIFAPRLLLRHLLAAVALQAGLITWNAAAATSGRLLGRFNRKHRDLKEARAAMRNARDYEEWKLAAERLDELEGHREWRIRPDSLLYDHEVLQSQIDELNAMMQRQDVFGLMFRCDAMCCSIVYRMDVLSPCYNRHALSCQCLEKSEQAPSQRGNVCALPRSSCSSLCMCLSHSHTPG